MIYTGKDTKTGGRLLKLKKYLLNEKNFYAYLWRWSLKYKFEKIN